MERRYCNSDCRFSIDGICRDTIENWLKCRKDKEKEYWAYPDDETRICFECEKPLKKLPLSVDDEISDMQSRVSKIKDGKCVPLGFKHTKCNSETL